MDAMIEIKMYVGNDDDLYDEMFIREPAANAYNIVSTMNDMLVGYIDGECEGCSMNMEDDIVFHVMKEGSLLVIVTYSPDEPEDEMMKYLIVQRIRPNDMRLHNLESKLLSLCEGWNEVYDEEVA